MSSWVDPDEQALADQLLRGVPGLLERCTAESQSSASTWPGPTAPLRTPHGDEPSPASGEPSRDAGEGSSSRDAGEGTWPLGLVLEALAALVASTRVSERPDLFRVVAPLLEHAAGAPETEDALRYGFLDQLSDPDRALLAEAAEPGLWESLEILSADLGAAASPGSDPGRS